MEERTRCFLLHPLHSPGTRSQGPDPGHISSLERRKANGHANLGLATAQFSGLRRALHPRQVASGRRRPGADGRAGQIGGCIGTVSKHVGIRGLEELDIVLHAAVGTFRLLQAILQVLQSALVAAVSVITSPPQLAKFSLGPAQLGLKV